MFILIPIFYSIWIYSELRQFSLLIFLAQGFFVNLSLYRQWCAMAILTFSFKYIKERFIPFLIIVILAAFFHRTALLFLIVYFLYDKKLTIDKVIRTGMLSLMVGLLGKELFTLVARFGRNLAVQQYNGGVTMLIFCGVAYFLYGIVDIKPEKKMKILKSYTQCYV